MSKYAVSVSGLYKRFDKETVLENISIDIEYGKIYGIIGRNGSGKTVFMKCVCGMTKISEGEVRVRDKLVGREIEVPESIGVIIETPGFLNQFTAYKNLKLLAYIRNKVNDKEIRDTIKKVGLNPDDKKAVGKFSLGMRQRLGIAQALLEDPDILLLDEPMNGLDNQGVEDMRKLLIGLKEAGMTIILASHSKEDISALCDSVIEFDHGRIL